MIKQFLAICICLVSFSFTAQGQNDPVLFTVEGKPVYLSEFNYIYAKTNGDKADYSKSSLDEYLELYKNFKLKVQRARDMKLDTIPALQRELAGYRQQLANSYLVDKEVTERLIKEAYDRTLQDVDLSHIMIMLKANATEKDIKVAEQKLINVKRKLAAGSSFEDLAKEYSEDNNTKDLGGRMGFFTALFPDGFYNLESAAYETPVGEVSDIFRTALGVHIVKVNARRPARGQVEVAHILVRKGENKDAKTKIDSLYQVVQNGAKFEDVAKAHSEDNKTREKGGFIGFIGIRQVGKSFEDAAFALESDGAYTQPFESNVGWHIVKRISKKPTESFDIAKRRIQTRMQESQRRTKNPNFNRLNNAQKTMIARIKEEGNFTENSTNYNTFLNSLDSSFVTYKWRASKEQPSMELFKLGKDFVVGTGDFAEFAQRNSKRMRMGSRMKKADLVKMLYDEYVDESVMKYEETQLEVKYPEFKSLMREYEEGILLFEATKILVWDKASQDSTGLKEFYEKRKGVYEWNERLVTTRYTVKTGSEDQIEKIQKFAKKHSSEEVLAKFNTESMIVTAEEKLYEKEKAKLPAGLEWKVGSVSEKEVNKRNKNTTFYIAEKTIPSSKKTLQEARGYVIADYQDYLEKRWLEELRKEYKIKVNQDTFKSIIKK